MTIINARSSSPFRITVTTDTAPDTTASDYTITRQDGATTNATVSSAFVTGFNTADLVVSNEALMDGVVYIIAIPSQSTSLPVSYRLPLLQSQVPVAPAEDPEAEAFGVDIDWFADALVGNGDTPTIRGRQCFVNDLAVIALIQKGEIFHRPDAGAGAKLNTNAPMSNLSVQKVAGSLTREWYKDPRTKPGGVTTRVDISASTGQLSVYGTVLPLAIDDPAIVKLPGGGT